MSVLVKGMEMPTSGRACMFSRTDIRNVDWCVLTEKDLPCNCPIVPAADVRPVVLCRDCVYSNKWYADRLICYLWNEHDGNAVFEDGFCNYGKKREES